MPRPLTGTGLTSADQQDGQIGRSGVCQRAARPAAAGQQLMAQQSQVVLLVQVIKPDGREPLKHRLVVAAGHHATLRDHIPHS